jgi:hypothetical protein
VTSSKGKKAGTVHSLLHHVNITLLRDSFYALMRQASPGVDGVRWQEYESGLEGRLADLHNRITVECIGRNLQDESLYRRPMDGNVRWASRLWSSASAMRALTERRDCLNLEITALWERLPVIS